MISFIRENSGKQPRHLHDGGVEHAEKELGGDANGEHEKRDRNYYPLLVRLQIGKTDTGFGQRTAEERLHRPHEHDGSEKETENGHRGKRGSKGEGPFEDEKLADESIEPG
jgi:hypothetical protein